MDTRDARSSMRVRPEGYRNVYFEARRFLHRCLCTDMIVAIERGGRQDSWGLAVLLDDSLPF